MDKLEVGTDNIYFEMESKQGTEARTYDEGNGNSKIPVTNRASTETSAMEAERKGQVKKTDTEAFRPMLLIAVAVVLVAFLTAVATLVLALTMMLSRNNSTASKDSADAPGE